MLWEHGEGTGNYAGGRGEDEDEDVPALSLLAWVLTARSQADRVHFSARRDTGAVFLGNLLWGRHCSKNIRAVICQG